MGVKGHHFVDQGPWRHVSVGGNLILNGHVCGIYGLCLADALDVVKLGCQHGLDNALISVKV